jgi:hypothetical protein
MVRHDTGRVSYPAALALTLVVEVPVYLVALSAAGIRLGRTGRPGLLLAAVGVNLATHPVVWVLLAHAGPAYGTVFWLVEAAAWVVEAALLCLVIRRDPVLIALVALVANLASVLAGVAVDRLP